MAVGYPSRERRNSQGGWYRPSMPTGTVKWFSDEKGYGFITPDEGDSDHFVHHSGIAPDAGGTLAEGAKVEFETESGEKGPKAVNVRPV
jgi:cold shock protein